jgi:hypothetical protein
MKLGLVILILILLIILAIGIFLFSNNHFQNNVINNNKSTNDSTIPSIIVSKSPPLLVNNSNNSFMLPTNDYVINHINWSLYPNLNTGYIYLSEVCEPNEIVTHKFIGVEILTEIKDTNNVTIIKNQLGKVAKETRKLYGPNSAICILGTDHGIVSWTVTMRVYDDIIYY